MATPNPSWKTQSWMCMLVELALREMLSSPPTTVQFRNVTRSEKKVSTPSVLRAGFYMTIQLINEREEERKKTHRVAGSRVDVDVVQEDVLRVCECHCPELGLDEAEACEVRGGGVGDYEADWASGEVGDTFG